MDLIDGNFIEFQMRIYTEPCVFAYSLPKQTMHDVWIVASPGNFDPGKYSKICRIRFSHPHSIPVLWRNMLDNEHAPCRRSHHHHSGYSSLPGTCGGIFPAAAERHSHGDSSCPSAPRPRPGTTVYCAPPPHTHPRPARALLARRLRPSRARAGQVGGSPNWTGRAGPGLAIRLNFRWPVTVSAGVPGWHA